MSYPDTVKAELDEAVRAAMNEAMRYTGDGLRDFSRNRKLTLPTLVKTIITMEGGALNKELYGLDVTPSAFIQQRAKVGANAFHTILKQFNERHNDTKAYRDAYRLYAIDGTALNVPYSICADVGDKYLIPSSNNPRGYCQMHLNMLYDLENKVFVDCIETADEIGALYKMLYANHFTVPTILTLDRGYESYNTIAHLLNIPNLFFVLRVKQDKNAMRDIGKLKKEPTDTDIPVEITTTQRNEDKAAKRIFLQTGSKKGKVNGPGTRITRWDFPSPYKLTYRAVRFLLPTGVYETIVTNLPRPGEGKGEGFTAEDIKELYARRWGIEVSIRSWKYAVGSINIHSRLENSIFQEVYASLIMHNYTSRIVNGVVLEKRSNKYEYRVDYTMAVELCRAHYRDPAADGDKLMRELTNYTQAVRPGRQNERNIKAKTFAGFTYRISA